jgi:tRNA pseudouridine38-40 synthase
MSDLSTPRTLRLTLAYDGADFHGWQVQPALATIQGVLASAIAHVTGEQILPQASGRTDAGVHALAQVVSFNLHAPIPAPALLRALNRRLPDAIRVLAADEMPPSFHARFGATAKTYEYRIFNRFQDAHSLAETPCPPTLARYTWDCPWRLSLDALQSCAAAVVGTHDFTSFAAVDPENSDEYIPPAASPGSLPPHIPTGNLRTIFSSEWIVESPFLLIYRVRGSGFLHHMVRNLVGTMVEAASARTNPSDFPNILAACRRSAAGATAPPHGLFLVSVEYGEKPNA